MGRHHTAVWQRAVQGLLLFCLLGGVWLASSIALAQQPGPSLLNPAKAATANRFRFPYNAVDPTPLTNPGAAAVPGLRGVDQLIIYTTAYGTHTQTNQAGWEATVQNGVIVTTQEGNSPIPADGFVLSGHGNAAQWLQKFALKGSQAIWDNASRQLSIQFTPATYLSDVDDALALLHKRTPADESAYQQHWQAAQQCRATLAQAQNDPISEDMALLAQHCEHEANLAYYNTFASHPDTFRGAWIRAESTDPKQIHNSVLKLKQAHIEQIVLETYFQGKTAYPSEVMKAYGLAEQHPRYQGADPVALWLKEAHDQGLRLHLWVQVFFAGNQRENIEQFGPILQKYPQWRNIERAHVGDPNPVISDVEPGHYFLDPANAEVREFLQKLILEMAQRYDADGLNLDYIRYPASAPLGKSNHFSTTWGYTATARAQFKAMIDQERLQAEAQTSKALKESLVANKALGVAKSKPLPSADPVDLILKSPLWPRWVAWRKAQVSSFVNNISTQVHALRPKWLISAVVFPSHDPTYALKLQDYPRWAREGSIQALTPIGLSTNLDKMAAQCQQLKQQVENRIPVYVGIFSLYNRTGPLSLVQEIETVQNQQMGGTVLFDAARLTAPYQEALLQGPFRLPPDSSALGNATSKAAPPSAP